MMVISQPNLEMILQAEQIEVLIFLVIGTLQVLGRFF